MPEEFVKAPKTYIDLSTGQLLIGEEAFDYHLRSGGHPADVRKLGEVLVSDYDLPSFSSSENNKYESWSNDDFVTLGKWLLNILKTQGSSILSDTVVNRASKLGVSPSTSAITYRFDRLTNYQQEIGQEKIMWKGEFSDWDVIDMARHIRSVALEEGRRPTVGILTRRISEGKKEPEYEAISRVASIVRIYELAGFEMPRSWTPRRYQEWGYLFYLANHKLPSQNDLEYLSPRSLGPSYPGITKAFGTPKEFRNKVFEMATRRNEILLDEIKEEVKGMNGHAWEFLDPSQDTAELMRKYARYKTIGHLLPEMSGRERMQLSNYDVIGEEFVDYLRHRDRRIETWMVEGAARISLAYPEIFPNGGFLESIKIDNETSFLDNLDPEKLEALREIVKEKPASRAPELTNEEYLSLVNFLNGLPLQVTSQQLYMTPPMIRRKYINGAKAKLKVASDNELPRKTIRTGIIDSDFGSKPKLTKKQREILELLSVGMSRSEAADLLGISSLTVRDYMKRIMKRLGTKSDVHSIMEGFSTGDLTPNIQKGLISEQLHLAQA